METAVITLEQTLCPDCGITFALPEHYITAKRNDHSGFYCPNGHSLAFHQETEAERLRRQLKSAQATATSWKDQAETAEARRRAEKGAKTKLQKRIANGVCPCCHRSFANVREHMQGQHPDFVEAVVR